MGIIQSGPSAERLNKDQLTTEVSRGTLLGLITHDLHPLLHYFTRGTGQIKKKYEFKWKITDSRLFQPWGLCFDASENLWVASAGKLVKYSHSGEWLKTIELPELARPMSIAAREDGHFVVVDYARPGFCFVDPEEGKLIKSVQQEGLSPGYFRYPYDVALPSDGTILVADSGNTRIQRFDPEGNYLEHFGSSSLGMQGPSGVKELPDGNLVVVNNSKPYLQIFSPGGTLLKQTPTPEDPNKEIKSFSVTLDGVGNILVPSMPKHKILIFNPEGNYLMEFGDATTLSQPAGIAVDSQGNLYISSYLDNTISVWG